VSFPDVIEVTRYEFAGAHITNVQITIVLLALLLMLALLVLVYRTRWGVRCAPRRNRRILRR